MLSNRNTDPMLSTCTVIEYSMATHINNKIAQINSILQHNSVIDEYSASVIDTLTVFFISKFHVITILLIRTTYHVALFLVLLSPV